ncbi:thiamine pyrophosphate-binding protein [uncultured Methanobrevibacter sp.]|uniref:thiamine pyrophosphate-binding protein n=1 Tax=uncultured Methanobrevibacter sp. TaxID=253161 RepID=UPI0026375C80|nr:thiamine pyrophosphate-binding protein [uncultured Methanobrevibacter sp.]
MNVASYLVKILEEEGLENIFGLPGEQILPFYRALKNSKINHILVRHEQAAMHAADAYYKSSHKLSACVATAAPGALNFTMALAGAYKDSVPVLVLTGDNSTDIRNKDVFQSVPTSEIFKNITDKTFNPLNGTEAVYALRVAIYKIKHDPKGPVHINLSNDVLLSEEFQDFDVCYLCENDLSNVSKAQELINAAEKPLFVLGSGAISQKDALELIVTTNNIPVTTTFNSKGIISEDNPLNLGLVGSRGTPRANYALKNSDCIIALGAKACERTFTDFEEIKDKLIHVNINNKDLKGNYPIQGTVEDFLFEVDFKKVDWLNEILKIDNTIFIDGLDDTTLPLRPQVAINEILNQYEDNIIIGDAGSHITWVTLLKKSFNFGELLFPAGLGPMGYGIPGAIGAAIANPDKKIIVINGDGDFQMNIQELATIKQYNLNISIFIINNSQYGIIRQHEVNKYNMEPYQIDLKNPDFVKIADAYGLKAKKVETLNDLKNINDYDVVEVIVRAEDIPLPK